MSIKLEKYGGSTRATHREVAAAKKEKKEKKRVAAALMPLAG